MPYELIHTSAFRGLHLGSDGYCTVGETEGIPRSLATQLEQLSTYRHRVKQKKPDLYQNPVAFSHCTLSAGGQRYYVISRIADTGFDHTNRTNYLAHHIAFTENELIPAGPAWLCQQSGYFQTEWTPDRAPQHLPQRRIPQGDLPVRACRLWGKITGDAGWAGVLAATYASRSPVTIVYELGQPVIEMLVEVFGILPANQRWRVSFNTYYTTSSGSDCHWRFVPAGSKEAADAIGGSAGLVLRLDEPMMGTPPDGNMAQVARTGVVTQKTVDIVEELPPPPKTLSSRSRRTPSYDDSPTYDIDEPKPAKRPRPVKVQPLEEAEDIFDEEPILAPPVASSPIKPLLLGLVLGMGVVFVGMLLIELVANQSFLRALGGPANKHEVLLQKDNAIIQTEKEELDNKLSSIESEKKRLEGLDFDSRNAIRRLEAQINDLTRQLADADQQIFDAEYARLQTQFALDDLRQAQANAPAPKNQAKKIEQLQKQLDALKSQARSSVQYLPVSGGRPVYVLPAKTAAKVEVLTLPANLTSKADSDTKISFSSPMDPGFIAILEYNSADGKISLNEKPDSKAANFWQGTILQLTYQENGQAKTRYCQFGTLDTLRFGSYELAPDQVREIPWPAPFRPGTDELALAGEVLVELKFAGDDGKEQSDFYVLRSATGQGASPEVKFGEDTGLQLRLKVSPQGLSLTMTGSRPGVTYRAQLRSGEIALKQTLPGTQTPIVLARISQ